jgi:hypothetical protein
MASTLLWSVVLFATSLFRPQSAQSIGALETVSKTPNVDKPGEKR